MIPSISPARIFRLSASAASSRASLVEAPLQYVQVPQVAEDHALHASVPHLPVHGKRGDEVGARVVHPAVHAVNLAEIAERDAFGESVDALPVKRQRGFEGGSSLDQPLLVPIDGGPECKAGSFQATVPERTGQGRSLVEAGARILQAAVVAVQVAQVPEDQGLRRAPAASRPAGERRTERPASRRGVSSRSAPRGESFRSRQCRAPTREQRRHRSAGRASGVPFRARRKRPARAVADGGFPARSARVTSSAVCSLDRASVGRPSRRCRPPRLLRALPSMRWYPICRLISRHASKLARASSTRPRISSNSPMFPSKSASGRG